MKASMSWPATRPRQHYEYDGRVMSSSYYYAGGQKIPLEPVKDLVALRGSAATAVSSTMEKAASKSPRSMELMDGMSLVDVSDVPATDLQKFSTAGDAQPVYQAGSTMMIPLPEVCVEPANDSQKKSVNKLLKGLGDRARVETGKYGQITVHLTSGRGDDAVQLANEIHEQIDSGVASPRFMQVTSSPDVVRPRMKRM